MEGGHGIRAVHGPGSGGEEVPGMVRMLGVLAYEQVYRILRNGGLPDGVTPLGVRYDEDTVRLARWSR